MANQGCNGVVCYQWPLVQNRGPLRISGVPTRPSQDDRGVGVASSRTGTKKWLDLAARAKRRAVLAGLTDCPICGAHLDFSKGRSANSAEVDHIIPWSRGGEDTIENVRVVCRSCNQRRGNGMRRKRIGGRNDRGVYISSTNSSETW